MKTVNTCPVKGCCLKISHAAVTDFCHGCGAVLESINEMDYQLCGPCIVENNENNERTEDTSSSNKGQS